MESKKNSEEMNNVVETQSLDVKKRRIALIQLFALNFRDLPWWIGLILLITPFFVHFLAGPNFHYTYYLPLYYKYVLPAAGIFLFTGLLTKLFFNKKKDKKTAEKSGLKKEIIS